MFLISPLSLSRRRQYIKTEYIKAGYKSSARFDNLFTVGLIYVIMYMHLTEAYFKFIQFVSEAVCTTAVQNENLSQLWNHFIY